MKNLFLFCCVVLLLSACQQSHPSISKAEMKEILHRQNEKLGTCFKEGDAAKLAAMYADSAKLCPNGAGEVYIGRTAIEKFWSGAMASSKLLEMKTETLTIDGNEEVIYETGKTTSKVLYQDSVYESTVKFANVWKKQANGDYLLDVDIWNEIKR
ncbi:MAG: YybH family protein [Bacteroidota bacterium]